VPEETFSAMKPGLLAMFSKKGWMILILGLLLLPLGFAVQAVGLLKSNALPRWQSAFFLIVVLLGARWMGWKSSISALPFCWQLLWFPMGCSSSEVRCKFFNELTGMSLPW
jgi:hypothetical protein